MHYYTLNFRQLQSQETELENLQHHVAKLEAILEKQAPSFRDRQNASSRQRRAESTEEVKDDDERAHPEHRRWDPEV